MKNQKDLKKFKPTDAKREFYSVIGEIRDLYENHGYLKAKSLFLFMQDKQKWQMSYISFSLYFNKEIKNKTPKEKPIIDNNYQVNQTKEKDIKDEKQQISTITNDKNERVISDEARKRYAEKRARMQPTIEAIAQCAKENFEKQQKEEK